MALSGSELRREGDTCEERGRGGTDCAGHLHTPDCDARDGEGQEGGATARSTPQVCVWLNSFSSVQSNREQQTATCPKVTKGRSDIP